MAGLMGVNALSEAELVERIVDAVTHRRGLTVSYAHGWTLANAAADPSIVSALDACDLCIADGYGVSVLHLLLTGRRLRKCTINRCFETMCRRLSAGRPRFALIASRPEVAQASAQRVEAMLSSRQPALVWDGFSCDARRDEILRSIGRARPEIVFLGMNQPKQEQWAGEVRSASPGSAVLCLGGWFDVLAGDLPRYPRALNRVPLEWLFRTITRPRKMTRRYAASAATIARLTASGHAAALRGRLAPVRRSAR